MEKISKIRKCYNCGITLQSDNPEKDGYVLPEILENPNQNFIFCQKCFEEQRFHALTNEPFIHDDFIKILEEAKENNCLLVYVVNLLSFEASFSKEVINLIKGMNIMVVGTKFDLLPEGTSKEEIQEYVAHRFRVAGLSKTNFEDVFIVSSKDSDSIQEALTRIFELKNAKDVYIIGSQDAGKTVLINSFLKIYSNLSSGNIVTCNYKDTRLKVMQIPLTKNSSMYETPGISNTNSILFGLDTKTARSIYVTKPLKPREITLSEGHSLFIGGLAIVELVSGPKLDLTCYFHENVELNKNHVRDVESKFLKLIEKGDLIPYLPRIKSINDLEAFEISFKKNKPTYRDLGFTGLGWICANASNQVIRVYLPKGVSIYSSRPKIKQ